MTGATSRSSRPRHPRLLAAAITVAALIAAGCEGRPHDTTSATAPSSSQPTSGEAPPGGALARAEAAAKKLGGSLRTRLTDAINQGGAPGAVRVCAEQAPEIAAAIQRETGVSVGRASLRQRNPANAPPAWVATWLTAQGERKAEGAAGMSAIVDTEKGRMARVIKPIAIEAACLGCHGDRAALSPEVKAVLEARYPSDRATGYAIGDLRGALWAEVPAGG
ncbi:MAG: DUF3365 domain-containing protein [Byssovorax sp.]